MAQALLNNLNINQQDSGFVIKDSNTSASETDFAKIFDSKTKDDKTDVSTISQVEMPKEETMQTIDAMENNVNSQETVKNELINTIQECAADTVIDLAIIKVAIKELEDAEETEEAEEIEEVEEVEETIEPEKIATETTTEEIVDNEDELTPETNEETNIIITEEDPTMYKELTTLEDPTVALMLHSQIQTTVKNVVSIKEQTEDGNAVLAKNDNQSINSENNAFSKFDLTAKDTVLNISKEAPAVKTEQPNLNNKSIDPKVVKELNVQVVDNENESDASSSDLMRQQTPQEQVAKVMIQGDVKFDKLASAAIKITEVKSTEISTHKIIEQISKQLDGMYNNSKLNMVLNPGTLGKVNLHIVNSKEGLIAQFTVTTQDAKDILMKGLSGLKESLLSQGISVDNVSVKLEESNDGESQNDWTEQEGSRGGYKQQGSQKQQKGQEKPFEQMMFELNNNDNV